MSEKDDFATGDYDGRFDIEAYKASIRAVLPHLYGGLDSSDLEEPADGQSESLYPTVASDADTLPLL